jgi:hypothetical protein
MDLGMLVLSGVGLVALVYLIIALVRPEAF